VVELCILINNLNVCTKHFVELDRFVDDDQCNAIARILNYNIILSFAIEKLSIVTTVHQ